jgi:secernin
MASDMVVALARATAEGQTLFGHNCNLPAGEGLALVRQPGRSFAPGETVGLAGAVLPQVRRTCTVLACRRAGQWGYDHGVNEHGVAVGVTAIRTRLAGERPGLRGTDLVRLALERAAAARAAVDVLTDLIGRHGQAGAGEGGPCDHAFLVADGREAFALEAAGPFWAEQVVGSVRALSDFCHLRQDWDRIARGLSDQAIARGWWPANGSKLDFAGALGCEHGDRAAGLRRWGRATLLLEQHSGQIDGPFLRRLLSDHCPAPAGDLPPGRRLGDLSLCQHADGPGDVGTAASLIVAAGAPESLPVAWWAFGSPCAAVYFPLVPVGDLPAAFEAEGTGGDCAVARLARQAAAEAGRSPDGGATLREALASLQEQFDQEVRDFLAEAAVLRQKGDEARLHRLAGSLMQHNLERWENICDETCSPRGRSGRVPHGSELEYAGTGN